MNLQLPLQEEMANFLTRLLLGMERPAPSEADLADAAAAAAAQGQRPPAPPPTDAEVRDDVRHIKFHVRRRASLHSPRHREVTPARGRDRGSYLWTVEGGTQDRHEWDGRGVSGVRHRTGPPPKGEKAVGTLSGDTTCGASGETAPPLNNDAAVPRVCG